MNEQLAEKFASALASYATTGDNSAFQKEAAENNLTKAAISPMLYAPLLSAGIGGLSGYYGTSGKEKQKRRNAIYGALGGGLTGFAGAALAPVVSEWFKGQNSPAADADGVQPQPPGGAKLRSTDSPSSLAYALDLVGTGAGGRAGWRAGARAYDKRTGTTPQTGELERLMQARAGKGKTNPYADPLRKFFDAHGPAAEPLASSLDQLPSMPQKMRPRPVRPVDPSTLPGFIAGHPDSTRAMDSFNRAVSQYNKDLRTWHSDALNYNAQLKAVQAARANLAQKQQDADDIRRTRSIGTDAAERARKAKVVEEILRNRGGRATGTLHSDLKPHARSSRGRNLARGAGGVAGGFGGLVVTDVTQRVLGNLIDYLRGNTSSAK